MGSGPIPLPPANPYPWSPQTSDDDDRAIATLGQVKKSFSFQISAPSDPDGDGVPTPRELELGTDPDVADSDGDGTLDFDPESLNDASFDSDKDQVPNGVDAVPDSTWLSFPRVPESRFAVLDLGPGAAAFLNNANEVLIGERVPDPNADSGYTDRLRVHQLNDGSAATMPMAPEILLGTLHGLAEPAQTGGQGAVFYDYTSSNQPNSPVRPKVWRAVRTFTLPGVFTPPWTGGQYSTPGSTYIGGVTADGT